MGAYLFEIQMYHDHTPTRDDLIRLAKVNLTECARRRKVASWNDFYWTVFGWAQNARRRAAACKLEPVQQDLFGDL